MRKMSNTRSSNQASVVLIQMVGEQDLPGIEQETMEIRRLTEIDFRLILFQSLCLGNGKSEKEIDTAS